jgi:hypothetical protein
MPNFFKNLYFSPILVIQVHAEVLVIVGEAFV